MEQLPIRPGLQNLGGRRLSKPRTITLNASYSTPALLEQSSPISARPSPASSRTDSTLDLLAGVGPVHQESRQKLREHLLGRDADQQPSRQEGEEPVVAKKFSVTKRISRTGTMIGKKASSRLASLGPSKSQSRLNLADYSDIEDEEVRSRMISEIREKVHNDSMVALTHYTSSTNNESGNQSSSLIRRRSLFTPGLATRNPQDLLRKPPTAEEQEEIARALEREKYYNSRLSDSSPLGRIVALDLSNGGRLSPVSRSATPMDKDYGNIGSSKFALRVANGAASPIPSEVSMVQSSRKTSGDPQYQESFYTASEGHFGDQQDPPPIQEVKRNSFDFVDRSSIHHPESLSSEYEWIPSDARRYRQSYRAQSPLRREASAYELDIDHQAPLPPPKSESVATKADRKVVDRTSLIAQGYIADISADPYFPTSSSSYPSPLEATSKVNEFEAELFDDSASRSSSPDYVDTRKWSSSYTTQSGDSVRIETTVSHSTSVTTTSSSVISSNTKERQGPRSFLLNADSGYSSSSSLYSIKNQQSMTQIENPRVPPQVYRDEGFDSERFSAIPNEFEATHTLPAQNQLGDEQETIAQKLARPSSMRLEPAVERGRARPAQRTLNGTLVPMSKYAPPLEVVAIPYESMQKSESTSPRDQSTPKVKDAAVAGRKKLQKKTRPKSQPPPIERITIQKARDFSGSKIPPVPLHIAARHAQRMQELPPLERTVPNVQTTRMNYEYFEDGPLSAPLRFPSPAHPVKQPKKRVFSGRRLSFSKSRPLPPTPDESQRYSGAGDHERGWSHQPPASNTTHIADFGDVRESLGRSPYDVATAHRRQGSPSKRSSYVQPHHFTTDMPRVKRSVGLNNEEASELSRTIAEYRALASQSSQAMHMDLPSPPTPPHTSGLGRVANQRRYFDDRGGIPGKMPHYQIAPMSAPPVPAIPVGAHIYNMEERAGFKKTQPAKDDWDHDWEPYRAAWAKRRQSAGEALRQKPNFADLGIDQDWPNESGNRSDRAALDDRRSRHDVKNNNDRNKEILDDAARPRWLTHRRTESDVIGNRQLQQRPPQSQTVSKASSNVSLRSLGVTEGNVARLSGRFENGYQYNYEPGQGIAGSAGTRNAQSHASRKSVEWSKGYGLDLTDVPIMIAPKVAS